MSAAVLEDVTAGATVLAALAAAWAGWKASQATAQTARLVAIEAQRRDEEVARSLSADPVVTFERRDKQPVLIITNVGAAAAQQLDVTVADEDPVPPQRSRVARHTLPVASLSPGGQAAVLLRLFWGSGTKVELELTWHDGRGPQRSAQTVTVI